ncbi:unnamed protein product [Echinostoma caproni]|uniref:Peptidase_M28 domain-containing protein n=1 Tax=Echinostoma caproni TaxID=27848 RepID=A0A183A054_9TREM|nr:unnamed protein product [Echinostoma caproni]
MDAVPRRRPNVSSDNPRSNDGVESRPQNESTYMSPSDRGLSESVYDSPELSFWIKSLVIIFIGAVYVCSLRHSCTINVKKQTFELLHFSSDNARVHLQRVTSLGPRPAGSNANELSAADYLRRELLNIARIATHSGMKVEFDEQVSNYSSFQTGFHVSAYNNLRNFLLKFHATFLSNCHYDSAVESPGASDDFVSCAIMLEACRIFALGPNNLTNDLIFLFNGAEESILPSSHAFVTQHQWAKEVSAFLNLEGAGSGGRLMVFQSGPGTDSEFLVNSYSDSFAQPYANVFAEELFQSGIIPSDTDFRVFRDFGRIPGLDMAYTSDGYCYHTRYDTESRISKECLQSTGEDIVTFLRQIVKTSAWTRSVYFDVLGFQLISVPWRLWKLFDWLLLTLSVCWLLYDRRFNSLSLDWIYFRRCNSVFGLIFAYLLGYLTHHYGCRMSWYSARYNLVGIYLLPFICWFFWFFTLLTNIPNGLCVICFKSSGLFNKMGWVISRKTNNLLIERDFFDAALFVIAFHMLVFDLLNSPAGFVSTIWLASILFGRVMYQLTAPNSLNSVRWTFFLVIPACLFWHFYFCASVVEFFIPVFGRSGQIIEPDIALSVCLFYLISPITLLFGGMMQCSAGNASRSLRLILLNACISYAVLVHASPYGFPYAIPPTSSVDDPTFSPRLQRIAIFHTERRFRDLADSEHVTSNDSFISILPLDVNDIRFLKPHSYPAAIPSSLFSYILQDDNLPNDNFGGLTELVNASSIPCNRSRPYCGTPSLYPYIHFLDSFYQIPSPPHSLKPTARLIMLSRTSLNNPVFPPDRQAVNLTFSIVSGPPLTHLLIRTDTPSVRLFAWSFNSSSPFPIPIPLPKKRDYPGPTGAHYFVYHVNAELRNHSQVWTQPWTFWLCLDFSTDVVQPHVDLAAAGIYVHDQFTSCNSPVLKEAMSRLPPWVTTMSGCSSYEHYRFLLK